MSALSIFQATGSFWVALVLAPIPVIAAGVVIERRFMRRRPGATTG